MAPARTDIFRKALRATRSTRSAACTASPRIQVHRNTASKKQVQIWLRSFPATAVSRRPLSTAVLPHTQYSTPDDLSPTTVEISPLEQFRIWFADAVKGGKVHEPEAMSLSTATPTGVPSARIVLFKQLDARGFVFFTNYTSRKSAELLANPHAALVFYWREIHRQVRVLGRVEKVSEAESAAYFKSRPLGSRLGAWASPQSTVVAEGEVHARLEEIKARFGTNADTEDADVPLPDFWGGWRVVPNEIEFWSGKPSRLHDRVLYTRQGSSFDADAPVWKIERLAP